MAVVNALVLVRSLLKELFPLGLEKLQVLDCDVRILALQVSSANHALLKLCVVDLSGDGDRNWCFCAHNLN